LVNFGLSRLQMEKGLTFLGVTAVVDELQDGVKETICSLLDAKINVWILSGDRQENAVCTAKSTGLIGESTPFVQLPATCNLEEAREVCAEYVQKEGQGVGNVFWDYCLLALGE
jgi:P-type E1-E2 ATPase